MTKLWPSRMVAFFMWLVVAASATYWILKISGLTRAPLTAGVVAPASPAAAPEYLARVLGPSNVGAARITGTGIVPTVDPGARMRLLGVVADRRHGGVALISLNGQPPRPYRVGSALDGGYTLTGVATRTATLSPTGQGAAPITLELIPPGAVASNTGGITPNAGFVGGAAQLSSVRLAGTAQSTEAGQTQTPAPSAQPAEPDSPEVPAKD